MDSVTVGWNNRNSSCWSIDVTHERIVSIYCRQLFLLLIPPWTVIHMPIRCHLMTVKGVSIEEDEKNEAEKCVEGEINCDTH